MIHVTVSVKNQKTHRLCEKVYSWNPSICACECSKKCGLHEYLKNCTWTKSFTDNLVIFCDKIDNTSINPNDQKVTYIWIIFFSTLPY